MTTVMQVFNLTMGLIDELNANSGAVTTETTEYKVRVPSIVNILRGELFPMSDNYAIATQGKRPVCPLIPSYQADQQLSTEIGLDDVICQTILPYGLAAHLLLTEDTTAAAFFQQRYEELIRKFQATIPATFEAIPNEYGCMNEYGWFSRW